MPSPDSVQPGRNPGEPSVRTESVTEKSSADGTSERDASRKTIQPRPTWPQQLLWLLVTNFGLGLSAARIIATYDTMHPRRRSSLQPLAHVQSSAADSWRQMLEQAGLGTWASQITQDSPLGRLGAFVDETFSKLSDPTSAMFLGALLVYAAIMFHIIGVDRPGGVQYRVVALTAVPTIAAGLYSRLDLQAILLELLPPVLLVIVTLSSAWGLLSQAY
ncbi:hypothetical protein GQ53DRAFT_838308 [Thozetella sp. PMI_491]|nr:hypothetical protein GQ53DRAFT_838308 [Thozetella sp. PMI_491]